MDNVSQKKSKKWIVYTSIIVLLALLFAFGPIFFARYMRSKNIDMAQKLNTVKTRLKVKGTLSLSEDNKLYLLGNNSNIYLIIGPFVDELSGHIGEEATIMGPIESATGKQINGENVRFTVIVDKYAIPDFDVDILSEEQKNILNDKINKRRQFVDEINAKLKKMVRFDVIKGKIELEKKNVDGVENSFKIIKDQFDDTYVLLGRTDAIGLSFDDNLDKVVVCLGKTTIIENIPLSKDEVFFEVFEIYDENLKKIK